MILRRDFERAISTQRKRLREGDFEKQMEEEIEKKLKEETFS